MKSFLKTFAIVLIAMIGITFLIYLYQDQKQVIPIVTETEKPIHLAFAIPYPETQEDFEKLARTGDLLILHNGDHVYQMINTMRSINPGIKIFSYKFSGISKGDDLENSAGGYDKINQECPECFIIDNNGEKVYDVFAFQEKKDDYLMDWGNSKWQDYSCNAFAKTLTKHDFDGIFLDVVYLDFYSQWDPDNILDYWGDEEQKQRVSEYLTYCKKTINGPLIINGAQFIRQENNWDLLFASSDGGMEEGFSSTCCWPGEDLAYYKWNYQISNLEKAASLDKYFIATTHVCGTDDEFLFGLSSYLLGKNHDKAYFMLTNCMSYFDSAIKVYDKYEDMIKRVNERLGNAKGRRIKMNDMWMRYFEGGLVIVNPSENSQSINLGATYSDSYSLKSIDKLTLQPRTGRILFN